MWVKKGVSDPHLRRLLRFGSDIPKDVRFFVNDHHPCWIPHIWAGRWIWLAILFTQAYRYFSQLAGDVGAWWTDDLNWGIDNIPAYVVNNEFSYVVLFFVIVVPLFLWAWFAVIRIWDFFAAGAGKLRYGIYLCPERIIYHRRLGTLIINRKDVGSIDSDVRRGPARSDHNPGPYYQGFKIRVACADGKHKVVRIRHLAIVNQYDELQEAVFDWHGQ